MEIFRLVLDVVEIIFYTAAIAYIARRWND